MRLSSRIFSCLPSLRSPRYFMCYYSCFVDITMVFLAIRALCMIDANCHGEEKSPKTFSRASSESTPPKNFPGLPLDNNRFKSSPVWVILPHEPHICFPPAAEMCALQCCASRTCHTEKCVMTQHAGQRLYTWALQGEVLKYCTNTKPCAHGVIDP